MCLAGRIGAFSLCSNECVLILCSFHRYGCSYAMSKSVEVLLVDIKSSYILGNTRGGREKYLFSCHFFSVIGVWSKERTDLIFRSAQHPHIPVKLMRSAEAYCFWNQAQNMTHNAVKEILDNWMKIYTDRRYQSISVEHFIEVTFRMVFLSQSYNCCIAVTTVSLKHYFLDFN